MKNLFNSFNGKKIMIVGDMMLDTYMNGKVERISPEAPVPIVSVTKTFSRLGGAANVAQNLKALGAEPILCSITGSDEKAHDLITLMLKHNMNISGIVKSNERITTTKVRIIGNNAQMLRVDTEDTFDLTENEHNLLITKINEITSKENIDGIILQDYNKGVLTEKLIKEVISIANKKNIPIGVDPKKKNFLAYQNATFFKPNLKELKEGIGISSKDDSIEEIVKAVDSLQNRQYNLSLFYISEESVIPSSPTTKKVTYGSLITSHITSAEGTYDLYWDSACTKQIPIDSVCSSYFGSNVPIYIKPKTVA